MKCLYAIPTQSVSEARTLCETYSAALESLSSNVVALSDDLRAFAESLGAPSLKVDDQDWEAAQQCLEASGQSALIGEIFWPKDAAYRAQVALEAAGNSPSPARTLASWLATQVQRDRAVVLLTA